MMRLIQDIVTRLVRLEAALWDRLFSRKHHLYVAMGIIHHCSSK